MTRRRWWYIGAALVIIAAVAVWIVSHTSRRSAVVDSEAEGIEAETGLSGAAAGPAAPALGPPRSVADSASRAEDREIFERTMQRALAARLDTLPIGERVVAIGRWFVGAPYTPGTLEVAPEGLVVNLREFDCVTYVESVLAMARVLDDGAPTFDRFLEGLRRIRYRDGSINGYASRLHYFTDWIQDNERKGIVRDVTRELGGIPTDEIIDFMSSNREAYRALEDADALSRIRTIERELSRSTRYWIPEEEIAAVAPRIRNGDVIAITSTIAGLDIAHTGFALWIDGRLHFMNAPLVGKDVTISERPLAQRVAGIEAQDGIVVARGLEP